VFTKQISPGPAVPHSYYPGDTIGVVPVAREAAVITGEIQKATGGAYESVLTLDEQSVGDFRMGDSDT